MPITTTVPGLVEIRRGFLDILSGHLQIPIYHGIASIYDAAVEHKKKSGTPVDELRIFQDLLKDVVPKWSPKVLQKEVQRIRAVTRMGTTLDRIYTAVMKATILLQTGATEVSQLRYIPKLYYTSPVFDAYIQRCYVLCAREFYNYPFLMSQKDVDQKSHKTNQRECLVIIKRCISDAIHHSLPIQEVLSEFLSSEDPITNTSLPLPFTNTISLLASDGSNIMDRVFSTYRIRESLTPVVAPLPVPPGAPLSPPVPPVPPVQAEQRPPPVLPVPPVPPPPVPDELAGPGHSITNFLLDDPLIKSESLVQSYVAD